MARKRRNQVETEQVLEETQAQVEMEQVMVEQSVEGEAPVSEDTQVMEAVETTVEVDTSDMIAKEESPAVTEEPALDKSEGKYKITVYGEEITYDTNAEKEAKIAEVKARKDAEAMKAIGL